MASANAADKPGRGWKMPPLNKRKSGVIQLFFLSPLGRNSVRSVGLVAASGVFMGYVTLNTWCMDNFRDQIMHYKHGFPEPVIEDLKKHTQEVMEDMKIKERFQKAIRLFYMYGFEPYIIGSLKTKFGVEVGVPRYFGYEKRRDVDKSDIQVEQKPIPWESEDGQLFLDSIILSDNAKKFAIAQQLSMADSSYVYICGAINTFPIILYTMLSAYGNQVFYGLQKPLSFRILFVYSFASLFSYGVWTVSRDLYNKYLENMGDKNAANLGINYAKGGVEYYSKVIQRNIAQRALMGPNGEKMFTQLGNPKELIRQKHVPLTDRKINAEKQVQKLLASEGTSQNTDGAANNNNKENISA